MQERLNCITDEVPSNAYFTTAAASIADGLCEQIEAFVTEHKDTALVAVDTFQMVRGNENDTSYANDYADIQKLKLLADRYHFSLLLVHHLRKQGDSDPLNKLSGITGITGAADAVFVLDKSRRSQANATLCCTGRDIEYREIELKFSKEKCVWEMESDSLETPSLLLPDEINKLVDFMKMQKSFAGSNTELTEKYISFSAVNISVKALKQLMNKWRYQMEEQFVFYRSYRSNARRADAFGSVSAADVGEDQYACITGETGKLCVGDRADRGKVYDGYADADAEGTSNSDRFGSENDGSADGGDEEFHRTGWERSREKLFSDQDGFQRVQSTDAKAMEYHRVGINWFGSSVIGGIGAGILSAASLIDSDGKNKTPEEIEAEERARQAGSAVGLALGAVIGTVAALKHGKNDEPDSENRDSDEINAPAVNDSDGENEHNSNENGYTGPRMDGM